MHRALLTLLSALAVIGALAMTAPASAGECSQPPPPPSSPPNA